jgi:hypothetical protein
MASPLQLPGAGPAKRARTGSETKDGPGVVLSSDAKGEDDGKDAAAPKDLPARDLVRACAALTAH